MSRTVPEKITTKSGEVLCVGLELSSKNWKLAMTLDGVKVRMSTVAAGSVSEVARAVAKAKEKLGLRPDARIVSCYEAGRDGFWIHRELVKVGIENLVVDPSSIEVNRRQRRAKTDRLDAKKLAIQLLRHTEIGDRFSVVRVPSPEDEDARRPDRELLRLKKERQQHTARMMSLLNLQGVRCAVGAEFGIVLDTLRQRDGEPLPPALLAELHREWDRLVLVRQQVKLLEKARHARIREKATLATQMAARLVLLKGVADNSASILCTEFFGFREFKNRRQVGACAGMVGTPFDSGYSDREQGISKAGNRRVRALAIELAWAWLWYQPESKLALWYTAKFGGHSSRMRRVGIVALARKLLVALWRFAEHGIIPEGAIMKAA